MIIGVSKATAAQLPSVNSLKRTVQRVRQQIDGPVASPENLDALEIPDRYATTLDGAQFLLFDSGPGNNRILIFSTATNMQMLSQSQHWYGDGTFKTVPLLFEQMYTIHGIE